MSENTLKIDLTVTPYLNLPLWNNQVPPIKRIRLRNEGTGELSHLSVNIQCSPAAFAPFQYTSISVAAASEVSLPLNGLSLDYELLKQLQEGAPATVDVSVTDGHGREVTRQSEAIRLLPASHWGGSLAVPEMLAAHVFPNDPAVARLLRKASELLSRSSENLPLDGYQSNNPRNAGAQALAVWEAMLQAGIHYANPPSSFEQRGQKIRTPTLILEEGLATCLDLAVLGAAALEQAGLHPILVVIEGHAYLACWLHESPLSSGIISDPQVLRKALGSGLLLACETTCLVGEGAQIKVATKIGAERISRSEDFLFAVDLAAARSGERILPFSLSSSHTLAKREPVQTVDNGLDLSLLNEITDGQFGPATAWQTEPEEVSTGKRRINEWKNNLLDLTRRNKLLNWRPTGGAMQLAHLDAAVLEDKLAEGKRLRFEPIDIQRAGAGILARELQERHYAPAITKGLEQDKILVQMSEKELQKNLLSLERKSRTSLEEGGANTLFIALGFVVKPQAGQSSRFEPLASQDQRAEYIAPLILLPVDLYRKRAGQQFTLRARDEDALLNPTLLELLKDLSGVEFPKFNQELPTDDSGLDVPGIYQYVREKLLNVAGWELVDGVALGEFSFAKYLMWRDLDAFEGHLRKNPIVSHLIDTPREPYRGNSCTGNATFPDQHSLDQTFPVSEMLTPMSADSSQLVAVRSAAQGIDFVLEGPPGTGKSQTITNIIAQCLGEGKTVLFVSEKTAALEVVHRRLQSVGLGQACLELHSNKISKSYVYDQLRVAMPTQGYSAEAERFAREAENLEALRNALNRQVTALHTPRVANMTVFSAISYAAAHADLDVPLPSSLMGLTEQVLADQRNLVKRLSALLRDVDEPARAALSSFSGPVDENAFRTACEAVVSRTDELDKQADAWSRAGTGAPTAARSEHHKELLALCALVKGAQERNYSDLALLVENATARRQVAAEGEVIHTIAKDYHGLSGSYGPEVMESNPAYLAARWKTSSEKWFLPRFFIRQQIKRALKPYLLKPAADLGADLRRLADIQEQLTALSPDTARGIRLTSAAIATATDRYTWAATLTEFVNAGSSEQLGLSTASFQSMLLTMEQGGKQSRDLLGIIEGYEQAFDRAKQALAEWQSFLGTTAKHESDISSDSFHVARSEAVQQLSYQRDWRPYGVFAQQRELARNTGLAYFVDDNRNRLEEGAEASDTAFRAGICRAIANQYIAEDPELHQFSGRHFEELIATFRQLDARFAELTTHEVSRRLTESAKGAYRDEHRGALGILNQELTKKRRHMPVRQLIKAVGGLLPELKPCFMMSPLSIAQYLPPDDSIRFDVVVFDEASQIPVWDAIGAIARGKQAIIVGDSKQLPPTNFFSKQSDEGDYGDEDEFLPETMESILDELKAAQMHSWRLRWHYRSQAESLIAFSNRTYYENELNTFPAPIAEDRALDWHKIDSQDYHKGRNEGEARALVAYLVNRLKHTSPDDMTFGIVTFNQSQQTLIEDLLEKARVDHPNIECHFKRNLEEPLFVKNIESVQGDERDAILFSVTYGPDTTGKVHQRFGPMNQVGGERRLTVAVTRARKEMQVFSSIEPEQIDLNRLGDNAQGARDLRVFLSYAKKGVTAFAERIQSLGNDGEYDSPFESAVAEKLRARGFETDPQIGVSGYRIDLGVRDPRQPGRYLAGIECDGASYHSTATARERDILRQAVLEGLGWNILRIWSLDWWHDADRTADKVAKQLNDLLEADLTVKDQPDTFDQTDQLATLPEQPDPIEREEGTPTRQVYTRTTEADLITLRQKAERLAHPGMEDAIYQPATKKVTAKMIRVVTENEAPLLLDDLIRRVATEGYGYSRAGSRIAAVVEQIARNCVTVEEAMGETVVWVQSSHELNLADTSSGSFQFRVPNPEQTISRGIPEIPLVELHALAKELIHQGLDDQALIREMGRCIGIKSVRGSSRDRVIKAIDMAWKE